MKMLYLGQVFWDTGVMDFLIMTDKTAIQETIDNKINAALSKAECEGALVFPLKCKGKAFNKINVQHTDVHFERNMGSGEWMIRPSQLKKSFFKNQEREMMGLHPEHEKALICVKEMYETDNITITTDMEVDETDEGFWFEARVFISKDDVADAMEGR